MYIGKTVPLAELITMIYCAKPDTLLSITISSIWNRGFKLLTRNERQGGRDKERRRESTNQIYSHITHRFTDMSIAMSARKLEYEFYS
jgi:hypothetical protein